MNRTEKLVSIVFVISILTLSVSLTNSLGVKPASDSASEETKKVDSSNSYKRDLGKLSPILRIMVKDSEGNLKYDYTKEDDLVLKTFLNWTVGWMTDAQGATVSFNAKDTGGTERTFRAYTNDIAWGYTAADTLGGYVQIGNSTTAPTRSNYALAQPRETKVTVSTPNYAVGNVTFSGTVTITGNYSASEVGFIMRMKDSSSTARDVMMFRDTFTPIPVVVNDQITATYTIMLNSTGFTDNFGSFLAGSFRNVPVGTSAGFLMSDTSSVPTSFSVYNTYGAGNMFKMQYFDARSYIAMGTNAAAQSRTDVALTQMIGSYIGVSQPSHNSTAVITAASQSINAVTTIREAGYFGTWRNSVGTQRTVMMWRSSSFTGVPTQPGYTVTITFRLRS